MKKGGGRREGEIKMAEEEDAGLTYTHKHMKNTSTCGAILTENKLETGKKAVKMIHTESTRKGREAIRLRPAPLGGGTEDEGDCTGSEVLPGE